MDRSDQFEYADQFMHRSALGLTQIQTGYWVESAPTAVGRAISYPSSTLEKIAEIESASFWFRHRNKMIASMVMQFPPIGPILDVGGGNGYVALELQRRGLQSIVLEADTAGALTSYYRGLPVIAALFKRDLFVPASVPAIGLFDVLEHVEDDKGFLSDCGAILNQGGMLYLTVPALSFLWSSDDIYAGHFRRYDRRSLSAVLQQAGFKIKTIGYFFSCLAPAIFLCRTLPSVLGFRNISAAENAVAHHHTNSVFSFAADWALHAEFRRAVKGKMMPIGSSLITTASLERRK